jgi:hypothetical protein
LSPVVGQTNNCGDSAPGGGSTNGAWLVGGNTLETNPVIGTLASQDFIIVTSGLPRIYLKASGRFGLGTSSPQGIFHARGHDSAVPEIGTFIDTFGVSSLTNNPVDGFVFTVPLDTAVVMRFNILPAVFTPSLERGSFIRTVTVYRTNAGLTVLDPYSWSTDYTVNVNRNFKVFYDLIGSNFHLKVQNFSGAVTQWTGSVFATIGL